MTDRVIAVAGAIPLAADLLNTNKNMMLAIGGLVAATIGGANGLEYVDGLALTATGTPSLTVNVGPGTIFALNAVDTNAFGSLGTDATTIVKMGQNQTATPFTLTAPNTSGQSINYLIEASFSETDGGAVVLPFYNPTNPSSPYSGPANAGTASNTLRQQRVSLQLKAGSAATTGTQTTPAVDSGWLGLYVLTVNYGQTQIMQSQCNGATVVGAPFYTKIPLLAPLASPVLTGTPTAPTPSAGDISTKLATTAFVQGNTPGRLINIQTFYSSGTYTPTAGCNTAYFEMLAPGGAGGGAGPTSVGSGGTAGCYAIGVIQAPTATPFTIGAAGTGVAGTNGGNGGVIQVGTGGSNFNITGAPGGLVSASANPIIADVTHSSGAATGGPIVKSTPGALGELGFLLGTGYGCAAGGVGGNCEMGQGGAAAAVANASGNGNAATGFGAGGGGAHNRTGSGTYAGGNGAPGIIIVWEYT